MLVKIRYKTDAKPEDKLQWRVLVDGKEYFASVVIINCLAYTTKDIIEGVGEKWHITCKPNQIKWMGDECILT